MKRMKKFNEKSMAKLESHRISNLTAIVGGFRLPTRWSDSCGNGGSDTYAVGEGTYDWMWEGPDACYYGDVSFARAANPDQPGDPIPTDSKAYAEQLGLLSYNESGVGPEGK